MRWRRAEAGEYLASGGRGAWYAHLEHPSTRRWRLIGTMDRVTYFGVFRTLRNAQQQAAEWETTR